MARLSDLPDRDRNRSVRVQQCLATAGIDQELRVLFLADGAFWGAAGMVRTSRDFTDRETEFLSAVAPEIATAATLAVRSEASRQTADGYPAIVVVGAPHRLRGSGRAGPVPAPGRRSGAP
jgi:hypothetical protein